MILETALNLIQYNALHIIIKYAYLIKLKNIYEHQNLKIINKSNNT